MLENPRVKRKWLLAGVLPLLSPLVWPAAARCEIWDWESAIEPLYQRVSPIGGPERREFVRGCSVIPPRAGDWSMAIGDNAENLLLLRGSLPANHSVYAVIATRVVEDPAPDGPEALRAELSRYYGGGDGYFAGRSEVRTMVDVDPSVGPLAVRFRISGQDRGVPGHKGHPLPAVTQGLYLVHPDVPSLRILAFWCEGLGADDSLRTASEADAFLASVRITRADTAAVGIYPVGGIPNTILFAHGSLWIAGETGRGGRGEIVRFDPTTRSITARIRLSSPAVGMASVEDAIWVAVPSNADMRTGEVVRVDARKNKVVRKVPCGREPFWLASGGGTLFVADRSGGSVWKLDGETGQTLGRLRRHEVGYPGGMVLAEGLLWVTDLERHRLLSFDPETFESRGAPINVCWKAFKVTAGGGALWVKCFDAKSIYRIDPSTRAVVAQVPTPGGWASGLGFARGALWVAEYLEGTLCRLDPVTNHFSDAVVRVGVRPGDLASTDDALWVVDRVAGTLCRIGAP